MQKIYTCVAIYFIKQKKKFEKFTISTNTKKNKAIILLTIRNFKLILENKNH